MERQEIEGLRDRVPCAAILENTGFAVDLKESTRRAVKYRRGEDIVIVIHAGKGWFDPKSDAKGDVYSLLKHVEGTGFAAAVAQVSRLVGYVPMEPAWARRALKPHPTLDTAGRWRARCRPWPRSMTWRYLQGERSIPDDVIRAAMRQDGLREGPHGSIWAAHRDALGNLVGWEERGPHWRGFASGGCKVLFSLGSADAARLCITEAAIDAMSLAAIEGLRGDTLYISTGGGWAPAADRAIRALAARPGRMLVAATDNNRQGEVYARRLAAIASGARCGFARSRPHSSDWNDDLRASVAEAARTGTLFRHRRSVDQSGTRGEGTEDGNRLPHARRPRQG